ncbi:DUF115 domain-containing protein [Maribacter sp.]|nr:DUF115 domain-containing protein [Maribacter sp.]
MFGRRESVAMAVVNFVDNCRRDLQFYLKWASNADLRTEMSRNKGLKNTHKGKRCFIVGNGPSLKQHDLAKLTDEYVFTVNNMIKTDAFNVLKPNFHLFFDPQFFDFFFSPSPENNRAIAQIKKSLVDNPDMILFSSYRLKSKSAKVFPEVNPHYMFNNKMYTPHLKNSSSIHRNTPAFQNVILYAINIALYMGFEKIYILGVDMTGFLDAYEQDLTEAKVGHFYETSKEDFQKLVRFKEENKLDNEFYLKAFGKTFEQFKLMERKVSSKNAKLFNASDRGALDVIDRVNYTKLFSNESD